MIDLEGLGLSPKKAQYLKFIFEHQNDSKTTEISLHFGVDPSTVTKTLVELNNLGLIRHEPYKGIQLTESGIEYAEFLVRRHRILSLILTHYGLSSGDACLEATRFENHVSKKVIDTMCRSMGHPIMGVCGKITHEVCDCGGCEATPGRHGIT